MSGTVQPQVLSPGRTAAWGLAILALTGAVNAVTATLMAGGPIGLREDGLIFSVGIVASALVGGGLLLWVLRGRSPRVYLALVWPRWSTLALWLVITAVTAAALEGITYLLGRPALPEAWVTTWRAASCVPLLLFALVVVAPIFEETYFRGFLQRGLAASRLGPAGAVAVLATLFAVVHFPEDVWSFVQGLALGVLLGAARQHGGSLVLCMLLHALLNARAVLRLALTAG